MITTYNIITCDYCGVTNELYFPIVENGHVIHEKMLEMIIHNEMAKRGWEYLAEEDWMACGECNRKEYAVTIPDEDIRKYCEYTIRPSNAAFMRFIRGKVSEAIGMDSNLIPAHELEVQSFVEVHSMVTTIRIRPGKNSTWLGLKKRYSGKESET